MEKFGLFILLWRLWVSWVLYEITMNVKVVIDNQQTIVRNQTKIMDKILVEAET